MLSRLLLILTAVEALLRLSHGHPLEEIRSSSAPGSEPTAPPPFHKQAGTPAQRLALEGNGTRLWKRVLSADDLPHNPLAGIPLVPINRQRSWELGSDNQGPAKKRQRTDSPGNRDVGGRSEKELRELHRLQTVKGMQDVLPKDIHPPIAKDVMKSRILHRFWNHKKDDKIEDFEHWNSETLFLQDIDQELERYAAPLHRHVRNAIEKHQRELPNVIHRAMYTHLQRPHTLLAIEEQKHARAWSARKHEEFTRRLRQDLDRTMPQLHSTLHAAVEDHAQNAAAEGLFYRIYHQKYPDPPRQVRSEYEHLARGYMRDIDADPHHGMQQVHRVLDENAPGREPGYNVHEKHAAQAGAAYANEFYPQSKERHFPNQNWNFPAGGGPWNTPDYVKEGYARPRGPVATGQQRPGAQEAVAHQQPATAAPSVQRQQSQGSPRHEGQQS